MILPRLLTKKTKGKSIRLAKFIVISLIKEMLENEPDLEVVSDFIKKMGRTLGELIYIDSFEHIKPSRTIMDFARNIKEVSKEYLDIKDVTVSILLNTEAKTLTISVKLINPLCEGFIAPNSLIRPGVIIVGVLDKIAEIKKESFNAYKSIVTERQCTSMGDEYDEFIMTFYLTDKGVTNALKEIEPNKWIVIK